MTIPLQPNYVYGPVRSRRLGASLGINILPVEAKFCNFDCVYCQYGWTSLSEMQHVQLPSSEELLREIEKDFIRHSAAGLHVDSITLSGNGEPTLHPELGTIIRNLIQLRGKYFPKAEVSILSNSSTTHRPEVRAALTELDARYMKLDAGDYETFCQINGVISREEWALMMEGLKQLPDITIQSLFMEKPVNNAAGPALENWLAAVALLKPKEVHVYSLDRPPADEKSLPVSKETLLAIAEKVKTLGIPAVLF